MKGSKVTEDSTTVDTEVELYDSDLLALEQVFEALNESRRRPTTVDGWRREIEDRIADIGFKCSVVLRQADYIEMPDGSTTKATGGQVFTSITITERIESEGEFDHERMRHEVRSNIRGLNPEGNVQQTRVAMPGVVPPAFDRTKSGLIVPKS